MFRILRVESEVVEVDRRQPPQACGLDGGLRAGLPVDDHRDGDGLGALSPQCLDGLQRRLSRGRGVFDDDDALARDIRPLDLAAPPMVLRLLAHDECIERPIGARGLVHDGVGDRIGAEREAADGDDVVHVADEVEHDPPDRRRRPVIEGELAHVDVVRRLLAARQGEVPVEHGLGLDQADEVQAVGLELRRRRGGHASESTGAPGRRAVGGGRYGRMHGRTHPPAGRFGRRLVR